VGCINTISLQIEWIQSTTDLCTHGCQNSVRALRNHRFAGRTLFLAPHRGFRPEGSIEGSIPAPCSRICKSIRNKKRHYAGLLQSPLTDSNRRPPLYEEGPWVKGAVLVSPSQGGRCGGGWRAGLISLSPPGGGGQGGLEFAPVAQLLRDRQAARGSVVPLGAKGWLRVSMCQIASARRRARSIWATLAPRCLPMRAFVCW
jgi:hypothetical protein